MHSQKLKKWKIYISWTVQIIKKIHGSEFRGLKLLSIKFGKKIVHQIKKAHYKKNYTSLKLQTLMLCCKLRTRLLGTATNTISDTLNKYVISNKHHNATNVITDKCYNTTNVISNKHHKATNVIRDKHHKVTNVTNVKKPYMFYFVKLTPA